MHIVWRRNYGWHRLKSGRGLEAVDDCVPEVNRMSAPMSCSRGFNFCQQAHVSLALCGVPASHTSRFSWMHLFHFAPRDAPSPGTGASCTEADLEAASGDIGVGAQRPCLRSAALVDRRPLHLHLFYSVDRVSLSSARSTSSSRRQVPRCGHCGERHAKNLVPQRVCFRWPSRNSILSLSAKLSVLMLARAGGLPTHVLGLQTSLNNTTRGTNAGGFPVRMENQPAFAP